MASNNEQLKPAPGPSYVFTVNACSNYPIQNLEYKIDLYDETIFLVYENASFDLIALVMAKLGQIFSEYGITGDIDRARGGVKKMTAAIESIEP